MRHRSLVTTLTAALTALALAGLSASPAQAAAPANDNIADATPFGANVGVFTVDTREATTEPTDGRGSGRHTVWWRISPDSTHFRATTAGSDYDTILSLFVGPRDHRTLVARNDDTATRTSTVTSRVDLRRTYWLALGSYGRRSGTAQLRFGPAPPAQVTATVDTVRTGGVSGRLLLTGTLTCASTSEADLVVQARQRVGDAVAHAEFDLNSEVCTTTPTAWTTALDSWTGWAFHPGDVALSVRARCWNGYQRDRDEQDLVLTAIDEPLARAGR